MTSISNKVAGHFLAILYTQGLPLFNLYSYNLEICLKSLIGNRLDYKLYITITSCLKLLKVIRLKSKLFLKLY